MFQQAFALALVGVIGTGVGVIASLIPIELVAKRDLHERVAKKWRLLDYEITFLLDTSEVYQHSLSEARKTQLKEDTWNFPKISASHRPTLAWQAAISDGDFIEQAPDDLLVKLGTMYSNVDIANVRVDQYNQFITQIPDLMIALRESTAVRYLYSEHYKVLANCFKKLLPTLTSVQPMVSEQAKIHAAKAKRLSKRIQVAGWAAVTIFLVSVVLFAIFATQP